MREEQSQIKNSTVLATQIEWDQTPRGIYGQWPPEQMSLVNYGRKVTVGGAGRWYIKEEVWEDFIVTRGVSKNGRKTRNNTNKAASLPVTPCI